MHFDIGNIKFWISPVSIMKCFIGIGWVVSGSEEELEEKIISNIQNNYPRNLELGSKYIGQAKLSLDIDTDSVEKTGAK